MSEKRAYTPAEFASLFGHEKTWTYRLLYAGKINGLSDYGRLMIPASEADRLGGEATPYRKKKSSANKETVQESYEQREEKLPDSRHSLWTDWIEKRNSRAVGLKGMRHRALPLLCDELLPDMATTRRS